jgi:hypothetical protein
MAIVRSVDLTGQGSLYDIPGQELLKYKVIARPLSSLSEEEQQRIPLGAQTDGDVEGFGCYLCWPIQDPVTGEWIYYIDDDSWC